MLNINLIEYYIQTKEKYPNKTAVVDDSGHFNFSELDRIAKYIGARIYAITENHKVPVAIYLPKSRYSIAAILGVLYSGNIYAPLDTKNPEERISVILKNLDPCCIITDSVNTEKLNQLGIKIPLINIDNLDHKINIETPFLYKNCIDTDPAYIIHTSGSTGVPKGVAVSHRSILDYIHWAIYTFNVDENENIGNQAPLVFDNSTLDIYLMVFTGATLFLIPEQLFMFPVKLLEYINQSNINFIFWVPSVIINIANMKLLDRIELPGLRKVLFAGEVMPTKPLNYWINQLDEKVLFANLYGPTEITVDCTFYIVNRRFSDEEVLPIGNACRNSDVLILNRDDQLCNINEEGELCVRGSSLALGYWGNFEKTSTVFVQNPLNRNFPELIYRTGDIVYKNEREEIMFVGRKDNQIKHLGYRIELGEIEHAVSSTFTGISPCVLYDQEKKRIVLLYTSTIEIPVSEFRKQLISKLSKYMIPSDYIRLNEMPLNSSGKIDRKAILKKIE